MSQRITESRAAVKPASTAHVAGHRSVVYLRLPPLAHRDFSLWPSICAIYESASASVVGIDLGHLGATTALGALRLLGAERVEPFHG